MRIGIFKTTSALEAKTSKTTYIPFILYVSVIHSF